MRHHPKFVEANLLATICNIGQPSRLTAPPKELGSGPRMVVVPKVSNGKRKQAAMRVKRGGA